MKRIAAFIFIVLVVAFNLTAQHSSLNDYVVRSWTTSDGLPGNSATDIIQTEDGYIYIGTYEGLVRFNGYDFTVFKRGLNGKTSFLSARTVFEDSKGNLWIGSNDEGLEKISKDGNIKYDIYTGLPNNSVRSIEEDKEGNIWVGTAAGLVYINAEGKIQRPEGKDVNTKTILVQNIFCDNTGKIWIISSDENNLFYYWENSIQQCENFSSFGEYVVTAMGQDKTGTLWFGVGQKGLARLSKENEKIEKIETGTFLDFIPVKTIFCDDLGSVWFGTEKGIAVYSNGQYSTYEDNVFLNPDSINRIMGDREGNIWVATDSVGIVKISLGKFRTVNLNTTVNAIAEDKEGKMWIACDDGLRCYENDVPVENELTEFCQGLRIRHVGVTADNEILVNCYTKPAQILYTKAGIQTWTSDEGLAGNKTRVSIKTRDGSIYVGTTTGLTVIKTDGTMKSYHRPEGFETEYIMCLYEDTEGQVWIGTDGGGVYVMENGALIDKITTTHGLSGNVIFKILQDEKETFWICTGSGISRFNKQKDTLVSKSLRGDVFNYNSEQGLGTDSIFQLLVDYTGKAWMISNRGICAVPFTDLNNLAEGIETKVDSKFYNQNDGLRTRGTSSTALSASDHLGRIWFTLVDGFCVYDPVKTTINNVLPIVHIESVKIDNNPVEDWSKTVIIPPRSKRIEIKYTGLSFNSPERTRFRYKMDGFENNFSDLTQNREATYTTLKPGKYVFTVEAMNGEGMFSFNSEPVSFIQKPVYYQRKAFWIGCFMLLLLIVVLIIISIERTNKVQQLRLETEVEKRTVELEMAKDEADKLLKNILPESIAERLIMEEYRVGEELQFTSDEEIGELEPVEEVSKKEATPVVDEQGFEEVDFDEIVDTKTARTKNAIADYFEEVTVLFSDIVGFTDLTSKSSAQDIVHSLNELFSRFDNRAEMMGIEKIKTIGDAYMAASGVPDPNPNHAMVMYEFAKGMYEDLQEYNKNATIRFDIRIGLNTGPVIAGVIGKNKFIYDVWGDTVNVASRMESVCSPGHIRMTAKTRFILEEKGLIKNCTEQACEIKGKGRMNTFEVEP